MTNMLITNKVVFGWNPSDFPLLKEVKKAVEPYAKLWAIGADLGRSLPLWREGPFMEFDADKIFSDIESWYRTLHKLQRAFRDAAAPQKVIAPSCQGHNYTRHI